MATKTQETKSGVKVEKDQFIMLGYDGENKRTRLQFCATQKEADQEAKGHIAEDQKNMAIVFKGAVYYNPEGQNS